MFGESRPGDAFYEEDHRRSYDDDELLSIANPYRACLPSDTSIPTMLLQPHHKRARESAGRAASSTRKRAAAPQPLAQHQLQTPPPALQPRARSSSASLLGASSLVLPEPLKPSEMMAILIVGKNFRDVVLLSHCLMTIISIFFLLKDEQDLAKAP